MATPRAYWKGYLRLSLVSIAVEMFPALESSNRPALHQIHRPSGRRIRYEKVVPGIGPVEKADIARGVEVEDDQPLAGFARFYARDPFGNRIEFLRPNQ